MEKSTISMIWKRYYGRDESIKAFISELHYEALVLHWDGNFQSALEKYKTLLHNYVLGSDEILDLAFADSTLVSVKIGNPFLKEVDIKSTKSRNAQLVLYYAKFYWAFWVDHKIGLNCLKHLFFIAPFSDCQEFIVSTAFLFFHIRTIAGKNFLNYLFASLMFKITKGRISRSHGNTSFANNVVIASFPYTQFVSGRVPFKVIEKTIGYAEENVVNDPFYNSLILIGGFYGYAYSGNLARTEIYAERFRYLQSQSKFVRYEPITEVMKFLPHALRGYGHLIEKEFFIMLKQHSPTKIDPVVNSQFYRACAVILLFLGKNDDAVKMIERARTERKKTASFGAWEKFDCSIEKLARREIPFDPSKDKLANFEVDFSTPPQLGYILFRLINEMPNALKGNRGEFINRIATVISEYLECKDFHIVDHEDFRPTRNPLIIIGGKMIEFTGVPKSRRTYVEQLFSSLSPMLNKHLNIYDELVRSQEFKREAALVELATVTAHNILGSLDALEIDSEKITYENDEQRKRHKRLLARVKTVANELLTKKRQLQSTLFHEDAAASPATKPELLSSLIDNIVKVKTLSAASKGIEINWTPSPSHYSLFCSINSIEFESVLGNIIDNSIDAIESTEPTNKSIDVSVYLESGYARVSVADFAGGIPQNILGKIAEKGFTTKPKGNGYGLFHAKENIQAWQGDLLIENTHSGASVTLKIPACEQPNWFANLVTLPNDGVVIVFDDDDGIHYTWSEKLRAYGHDFDKGNLISCYDVQRLYEIVDQLKQSNTHFILLSDYEILNEQKTGLDIIKNLDIASSSYIVSSYYREDFVTHPCAVAGIKIVPKNLARFSRIYKRGMTLDGLQVEDTDNWQNTWKESAEIHKKNILSFHSIAELLSCIHEFPRSTEIYIDSRLGAVSGEDASKELSDLGYRNLHLSTATDKTEWSLLKRDHIKSIVGKAFPWRKSVSKTDSQFRENLSNI